MPAPKTQTTPDAFKLEEFGGMLPAWDDALIPQNQASYSLNGYLFNGNLDAWRKPKLLYTFLSSTTKFAYRLPRITEAVANACIYVLAKPVDGDTVTLGEEIYTFRDVVEEAYDVLIGASDVEAVTHLWQAFTADLGENTHAGTNYGVGTISNPAIDPNATILATDIPRINCFAPEAGAAFNSTLVGAANAARLVWKYVNTVTTHFQGGANITFDASVTGASTWIEFDDPDTDVLRSPVVDDSFDRYYFASSSVAPKYNTRARIEAGEPAWFLGVPAPGCTPGIEISGGGNEVSLGLTASTLDTTATVYQPGANTIYLIPVTPDGAVSLESILITPRTTSTTARFAGLVYEDDNGSPGSLINASVIVTGSVDATDLTLTFQNPSGLLANVQVWIGFMCDTAIDFQRANDTGATGITSVNAFSAGPPPAINNLSTGAPDLHLVGNGTSSALLTARSYVYTYVTEYDEESAPSPATVDTGWSNGTWTISLFTPPPDQMGVTRNITKTRIYRTVTAQSGGTVYYFVAEVDVTDATYVDNISDDVVVTNTILQSQLWTPPPENLQGFVAMPNGMMAGWKGNELWFCEPYRPHAWPASYVLTTEYPIVGLGVTGNSVVACTTASPYIASGPSPGAMSATKVDHPEPCHSRGSIVSNNDGVYYASVNGLVLVNKYGAVQNTTDPWITREKWKQLTPLKNVRSIFLASCYYALGCVRNGDTSVAQEGFTIELNVADAQSFGIWPQPGGHRIGFNLLGAPNGFDLDNLRLDPWSSVALYFQNGSVYWLDFGDEAPVLQTYKWKSKRLMAQSKKNYAAMRIWFDIPPGAPALNPTRLEAATDDPVWDSLPADRYGFIRVYAAGRLVTVREIRRPQETLRILSGLKNESWHFEVEARVPVSSIQVGTSVKAMAQV